MQFNMAVKSVAACVLLIIAAEAFIFRQPPPKLPPHPQSLGLSQALNCLNVSANQHTEGPYNGGKLSPSNMYGPP